MTGYQLRRGAYLVLAVVGLVGTAYFNAQWLAITAIAFTFPLFLFFRERHTAERAPA